MLQKKPAPEWAVTLMRRVTLSLAVNKRTGKAYIHKDILTILKWRF